MGDVGSPPKRRHRASLLFAGSSTSSSVSAAQAAQAAAPPPLSPTSSSPHAGAKRAPLKQSISSFFQRRGAVLTSHTPGDTTATTTTTAAATTASKTSGTGSASNVVMPEMLDSLPFSDEARSKIREAEGWLERAIELHASANYDDAVWLCCDALAVLRAAFVQPDAHHWRTSLLLAVALWYHGSCSLARNAIREAESSTREALELFDEMVLADGLAAVVMSAATTASMPKSSSSMPARATSNVLNASGGSVGLSESISDPPASRFDSPSPPDSSEHMAAGAAATTTEASTAAATAEDEGEGRSSSPAPSTPTTTTAPCESSPAGSTDALDTPKKSRSSRSSKSSGTHSRSHRRSKVAPSSHKTPSRHRSQLLVTIHHSTDDTDTSQKDTNMSISSSLNDSQPSGIATAPTATATSVSSPNLSISLPPMKSSPVLFDAAQLDLGRSKGFSAQRRLGRLMWSLRAVTEHQLACVLHAARQVDEATVWYCRAAISYRKASPLTETGATYCNICGIILNPIESGIHRLSAVIEQESPLAMKTTGVPQCQGELELYTELLDLLRQHSKKAERASKKANISTLRICAKQTLIQVMLLQDVVDGLRTQLGAALPSSSNNGGGAETTTAPSKHSRQKKASRVLARIDALRSAAPTGSVRSMSIAGGETVIWLPEAMSINLVTNASDLYTKVFTPRS